MVICRSPDKKVRVHVCPGALETVVRICSGVFKIVLVQGGPRRLDPHGCPVAGCAFGQHVLNFWRASANCPCLVGGERRVHFGQHGGSQRDHRRGALGRLRTVGRSPLLAATAPFERSRYPPSPPSSKAEQCRHGRRSSPATPRCCRTTQIVRGAGQTQTGRQAVVFRRRLPSAGAVLRPRSIPPLAAPPRRRAGLSPRHPSTGASPLIAFFLRISRSLLLNRGFFFRFRERLLGGGSRTVGARRSANGKRDLRLGEL